jgi:hypothetical protein
MISTREREKEIFDFYVSQQRRVRVQFHNSFFSPEAKKKFMRI